MNALLQVSLVLLTAGLAALFATRAYFRQREHELILSRYLEGGLDLLAAETESLIATFNHNWARSLAIIKSFRDAEEQFDVNELSLGFIELHAGKHNVVAQYRVFTLTGAGEYWTMYQKALAYFTNANSIVVKEIPEALRVKLKSGHLDASFAYLAQEALVIANREESGGQIFVQLIAELQYLSAALESEHYRFKDLPKFRNKPEVQESLTRMKGWLAQVKMANDAQRQPAKERLQDIRDSD